MDPMPAHPLFAPGAPAVRAQVAFEALRTVAVGVVMLCLGRLLADVLDRSAEPSVPVVLTAAAAVLVAAGGEAGSAAVQGRSTAAEARRLRGALLRRAFGLGPARITGAQSGRLVAMMTDSVERVTAYRQGYIGRLVAAVLAPLLTILLVAVAVDWLSALVLLALVPVIPLAIGAFQRLVAGVSSASREARMRLAGQFLEAIQGLPTLVGLRAAGRIGDRLEAAGEDNRRATMSLLARNQLILFVTEAVFSLFMVSAAVLLAWVRHDDGAVTLAGALALVLLSTQLTEPMNQIGGFFYIGMAGRAGQRMMTAFVDRGVVPTGHGHPGGKPGAKPGGGHGARNGGRPGGHGKPTAETCGRPGTGHGARHGAGHGGHPSEAVPAAAPAPQAPSSAAPSPRRGDPAEEGAVVVQGVGFAYEPGKDVLTDVDLTVAEREQTALLGASGSGKSTLLSVLAGDLLPTAGTVRVNGVPLTAATQDEVRAASAVVQQHTWLFRASLAENLRIAAPDATDEQLWEALEQVDLARWARTLPQGLDTPVGERGLAVSGGQGQRIALARAFLAGRPLVILDEPTSQVDLESEAVIEQAVERLGERATVVLATHRPSLAGGRAVHVRGGRIAEDPAQAGAQTTATDQEEDR